MTPFTEACIKRIQSIPKGKVATYGQIAKECGNPRGARQVSRILHSMTKKYDLPWHRIINSQGIISLTGEAFKMQKEYLEEEGVFVSLKGKIDLKTYQHIQDEFTIDEEFRIF